MANSFNIIDKHLQRIEFLLEKLVSETTEKKIKKNNIPKIKKPTDEEMDAYLLKHVFSKKK